MRWASARVKSGRSRVVDRRARAGQGVDGVAEDGAHGALDGARRILQPHCDAVVGERSPSRRRQLQVPGGAVGLVGAGEHVHRQRQILRGAPERPDDGEVHGAQRARWRGDVPAGRDDAEAGLVPVDAAVVRRVADRAANVAAEFQRRLAGGQRSSRTARRTAR